MFQLPWRSLPFINGDRAMVYLRIWLSLAAGERLVLPLEPERRIAATTISAPTAQLLSVTTFTLARA